LINLAACYNDSGFTFQKESLLILLRTVLRFRLEEYED